MTNRFLLILALLCFVAMLSAQATNLIISEYVEGTSFQKAIEIFNGTGAPVSLSQYSLRKQTNGAGAFGGELVLSGTLPNNDVYVIVNSFTGGTNLAGQPFVDLATTSQSVNFNGNDAIALYHNGVQIDVVGIVNQVANWGMDVTWVRNSNVASPTVTFTMGQWTVYPVNTFTHLGAHVFNPSTNQVATPVFSPASGLFTSPISVTITCSTPNSIIYYTTDGSNPTTTSMVYLTPIPVSANTTLKALATATGMDNSFVATANYTFPVTVANLAQLRALPADNTSVYHLTGEVVLTFKQTFRNQKFVQDATAAILIDDNNGVITTVYNVGDGITGILGRLSTFGNMLQFVPVANPGIASSTGNEIVPQIVTLSELTLNFEAYESELVKVLNVTFVNPTGNFANGTVYPIQDATATYNFRTTFFSVSYINTPIPSTPTNIVCIPNSRTDGNYITARDTTDFTTPASPVAAPTFDPPAGLYYEPINVSITSATTGALIYYTTDGADPTDASTLYTTPLSLTETTTLKAIAISGALPPSEISTAVYTIVVSNNDMIAELPEIELLNNYPNPFNVTTEISFRMKNTARVSVEIFNIKGQLIRTLNAGTLNKGINKITWNARDEQNRLVPAGIYYYRVNAGKFTGSKKMILMK